MMYGEGVYWSVFVVVLEIMLFSVDKLIFTI